MLPQDCPKMPETATMSATEAFHKALNEYSYTGGNDYNIARRLFEDAHWVRDISMKMPNLAHGDLRDVLDLAGFETWIGEGCTYASAARLIREKLAHVVNGKAA